MCRSNQHANKKAEMAIEKYGGVNSELCLRRGRSTGPTEDGGREVAEDVEANEQERTFLTSELGSRRRLVLVQLRRCCTCCSSSPFQAPAALATSSPQCCRRWKETIYSEYKGATVTAQFTTRVGKREGKQKRCPQSLRTGQSTPVAESR